MQEEHNNRSLTDADIDAIIVKFWDRFMQDLGRGLSRMIFTAFIGFLLMVAAWGAVKTGITELPIQH